MHRQKDFPRQIVIGESLWTVHWKRDIPGARPGRIVMGMTYGDDKEIHIRMRLSAKERLATFVHELLHALEYEYGIAVPHEVIYKIDAPLARLIIDNLGGI